mmetsp:Transcript_13876/g.54813  ORF Transcript_13876/g.54813 Transcript_13876/m.54813 type:complete len:310 (-) Transcript_13876:1892-2821(-)
MSSVVMLRRSRSLMPKSWQMSATDSFMLACSRDSASLPRAPSARASFTSCSLRIRSSSVSLTVILNTSTGSVWPMRWTRSIACSSAAGFHQGSMRRTLLAIVRSMPTPAPRMLRSMTETDSCSPNCLEALARACMGIEPSMVSHLMLRWSSALPISFRKLVHWLTTTTLGRGLSASMVERRSMRRLILLLSRMFSSSAEIESSSSWPSASAIGMRLFSESIALQLGQIGRRPSTRDIWSHSLMHFSQKPWPHVVAVGLSWTSMQIEHSLSIMSRSCFSIDSRRGFIAVMQSTGWQQALRRWCSMEKTCA